MSETTIPVKVKWGKETLNVDVDTTLPVEVFKAQLQSLTGVPSNKQKITGVKGGALKDDAELSQVGLTAGKMLMMIGTVDSVAAAPTQPVLFAEDQKSHHADALTTTGLKNLGNTCYLNSALQTLRLIPELRTVLKAGAQPVEKQLNAVYGMLDGTREPVAPMLFLQTFLMTFPTFASTDDRGRLQQQDSQEALGSLLQTFQQDIEGKQELAPMKQLLRGLLRRETTPLGVDGAAPTIEESPFSLLPCNIDAEIETLELGLERGLTEQFTGQHNGSETLFARKSRLAKLPEYLFVHFVRFAWRKDTKQKAKSLKPVSFPMVLDVSMLCTDELKKALEPQRAEVTKARDVFLENRKRSRQKTKFDDDDEAKVKKLREEEEASRQAAQRLAAEVGNNTGYYELCAVISHKGRDADGGHYVAWVKKKDSWLVCDDDHVGVVTEDDVKRLRGVGEAHIAYVLLYRSRDPDTKALPIPL